MGDFLARSARVTGPSAPVRATARQTAIHTPGRARFLQSDLVTVQGASDVSQWHSSLSKPPATSLADFFATGLNGSVDGRALARP